MVISREEFMAMPHKAITLMGMSGVGKTYLSDKLESWGWEHHSCDFLIGSEYLRVGLARDVTVKDMSALSDFVGKIGDPALGGLALDEFRRRQKMYYEAECQSLRDAMDEIDADPAQGFVNDSTGSMCEIEDEALIEAVCNKSLLVYIQATPKEEARVLQRAQDYPKPLFFPEALFAERLAVFMAEQGLDGVDQLVPDDFARWVFPFLFAARLPKYKRIADCYGVTISSAAFKDVAREEDFLNIVANALGVEGKAYG